MFIIICIVFIFLTWITYHRTNRMNIAIIYCGMWTFLSIAVCILGLPKNREAFLFVLFNTIIFVFTYMLIPKVISESEDRIQEDKIKKFEKINKIILFINIFGLLYLAYKYGFSISSFRNISTLMTKMSSISHLRYSEIGEDLPIVNRLINSIVYASLGYAGFYSCKTLKKDYFYNIIVVVLQTVLTNTKATLVFAIAFWAGGFLTGFTYYRKKIDLKKVLITVSGLILLLVFATLIDYLRHRGQYNFYEEFRKIISSYFVGPYSAFSVWFDKRSTSSLDLGKNTFASIFRLLGISEQQHGEFVVLNGIPTNVYTVFKHLINDYSLVGTLFISFLTGLISAIVDNKIAFKRRGYIGLSIVIMSTILITFFSSIFRYTVNVIACFFIICASLPIKIKQEDKY